MKRTILSVCNWPLTATRDYSENGVTAFKHKYEIPAVPKGEYRLLADTDLWDRMHVSEGQYSPLPVYGEHIADDLVEQWTGDMAAGRPGCVVIKGDEPTPEEIAFATNQHVAYCTARRNEANKLWAENKRDQATGEPFRLASEYLGTPNDPWCLTQNKSIQVKCQWCGVEIDIEAALCSHCGKVANFNRYQELLAKQAEIERMFKESAMPKPVAPPIAKPEPVAARN